MPPRPTQQRKKVAIVGSGIAGLSSAWLLSRDESLEVHLFEKRERLGMDANAVVVNNTRIDTPPRALSDDYYPNLSALYKAAGVDTVPFSWAFTYFEQGKEFPYLCVGGGATAATSRVVCGFRVPTFSTIESFFHHLKPANLRAFIDVVLFHNRVRIDYERFRDQSHNPLMDISLGDYLKSGGFGDRFANLLLLPMLSMVCTCDFAGVLHYPAWLIIEYLCLSTSYQQRRTGPAIDEVAHILSKQAHVHLNANISSVRPSTKNSPPQIVFPDSIQDFDEIVFATDAPSAIPLLPKDAKIVGVLGQFEYQKSEVVVHTCPSVMPTKRSDWSAANLSLAEDSKTGHAVMFTLHMSHPDNRQHTAPSVGEDTDLFMTWNPHPNALQKPVVETLKPNSVISRQQFGRSLVTCTTRQTVSDLWSQQGEGGLWFVGAYSCFRVPLQESAVTSSVLVATKMGVPVPWGNNGAQLQQKQPQQHRESISPTATLQFLLWIGAIVAGIFACGFTLSPASCSSILGQQLCTPHAIMLGPISLRFASLLSIWIWLFLGTFVVSCLTHLHGLTTSPGFPSPTGLIVAGVVCAAGFLAGHGIVPPTTTWLYFAAFLGSATVAIANFPFSVALALCPRVLLAFPFSFAALGVTWHFILSFFASYTRPENVFVAAYADVVDGVGWIWSCQLLLGVIPLCLFVHYEAALVHSIPRVAQLSYVAASFLGAVSFGMPLAVAHLLSVSAQRTDTQPQPTTNGNQVARRPSRPVWLWLWVFCIVPSVASVWLLPRSVKECHVSMVFVCALAVLHAALILPFALLAVSTTFEPSTAQRRGLQFLFCWLGIVAFVGHALTVLAALNETVHVENVLSIVRRGMFANDCQTSISIDSLCTAVLVCVLVALSDWSPCSCYLVRFVVFISLLLVVVILPCIPFGALLSFFAFYRVTKRFQS